MKTTLEEATRRYKMWGYLYNASVFGIISFSKGIVDWIKYIRDGYMHHRLHDHLLLSRLYHNSNHDQLHFRQRTLLREAGGVSISLQMSKGVETLPPPVTNAVSLFKVLWHWNYHQARHGDEVLAGRKMHTLRHWNNLEKHMSEK